MLKIDNITMQFGGVKAVCDTTIDINFGEIIGLIGPNGAGKTTVFNMVTGVYTPTKGQIYFEVDGKDINITGKRPDEIAYLGLARTFQNIRLFKEMTVAENVFIGNHLRLNNNWISSTMRFPSYLKQENKFIEKTNMLLKRVGLYDLRNEKSSSLPYGDQRKLEIARALATDPTLLLLDEPAAGMNPQETAELMKFIVDIRKEFNLSIFLIEHHMELVLGISDRIYVLDHGEMIADGYPSEIQNDPKVIEAYLGVE